MINIFKPLPIWCSNKIKKFETFLCRFCRCTLRLQHLHCSPVTESTSNITSELRYEYNEVKSYLQQCLDLTIIVKSRH